MIPGSEEDIEHGWVELRAATVAHDLQRSLDGVGAAVHAVAREGVEHVGHRGDAAFDRDRIGDEPVRVPGAVVALVVRERDARSEIEQLRARAGEDAVTDRGVLLHLRALGVRERSGLEQDRVRDTDLADVVERARRPDRVAEGLLETEPSRDQLADLTHPLDMSCAGGIARLRGRCESPYRLLVRATQFVRRRVEARDGVGELVLHAPALLELDVQVVGQLRPFQGK